uniref:Uncharacterized protein n=1 Tax=Micrurus carvalhoi TaxID=3147026 RepID=A0A2H6N3K0_9SAUR
MPRQIHSDRRNFVCKNKNAEKPTNLPCHWKWRKFLSYSEGCCKALINSDSISRVQLLTVLYCTTYFTAITRGGSLITFKVIYANVSVKIGRQGMVTAVEMGCKRSITLSTGKGIQLVKPIKLVCNSPDHSH